MTHSVSLHRYLDVDLISVQSDIRSRKKLLQEMARLLCMPLTECKEKDVYHLLLEREKLGNTGIGNGVALPHSRCNKTDRAIVAIITVREPVDYDSLDKQAVNLAFGLLVPQSATSEHLGLLAEIAKFLSDGENKQRLCEARSAQKMIDLLTPTSEPQT